MEIGTYFFFRKNIFQQPGVCSFCGQVAELTSFDALEWAYVRMIPLFPVGHKRVTDQCSRCSRYRVYSLSKWQFSAAEYESLRRKIGSGQFDSPEIAFDFMRKTRLFKGLEPAITVAKKIETQFAGDEKVEASLVRWYNQNLVPTKLKQPSGSGEDAEVDKSQGSLAQALAYKREGRLLESAREFQRMTDFSKVEAIPLVNMSILMAKSHAPAEAFPFMGFVLSKFPKVAAGHEIFRKEFRNLEAQLGISESLLPKKSKVPAILSILVGLVVLGGVSWIQVYSYNHQELFLMNSLPVEVEISVDDSVYVLAQNEHRMVKVKEGFHQITALLENGQSQQTEVEIKNNPLERFQNEETAWVYNAFGATVLYWEEIMYVEEDYDPRKQADHKIYLGEPFYEFRDIDFRFRQPDPTATLNDHKSYVIKNQLTSFDSMGWCLPFLVEQGRVSPEWAMDIMELKLTYGGANLHLLHDYRSLDLPPELAERRESFFHGNFALGASLGRLEKIYADTTGRFDESLYGDHLY
ncbi:MAG: hypothetical protein H6581_12475 [Bacteroidia bacterium]|nr:hypothetical protein [Bacteroidia bacterium]